MFPVDAFTAEFNPFSVEKRESRASGKLNSSGE